MDSLKNTLRHLKHQKWRGLKDTFSNFSYSQCGEDRIVAFVFDILKVPNPCYLDIGAHHPTHLSNTYLFYQRGCKGVCIEPDPTLFSLIQKRRRRDLCLNVGVGVEHQIADLYIMDPTSLNTFSKVDAEKYAQTGFHKIQQISQIQLIPINDIIRTHFSGSPDFVSLDIEGMDLKVLQSLDFSIYRPKVFCIETLEYSQNGAARKINEIIEYMEANDYIIYADTYINSIFITKEDWDKHLR